MSDLLSNQEFRDSVIYSVVRIRGVPVEGCVMMQYPLFAKLLEVSIGGEGGTDFLCACTKLDGLRREFCAQNVCPFKNTNGKVLELWS